MADHASRLRSNAAEWDFSECSERARWAAEAAAEIERLTRWKAEAAKEIADLNKRVESLLPYERYGLKHGFVLPLTDQEEK